MKKIFNKVPKIEDVVNGIELALMNAGDLLDSAKYLLVKDKYHHSANLSLTANQELGKIKVLHFLTKYINTRKTESDLLSKAFFHHQQKIVFSEIYFKSIASDTTINDLIDTATTNPKKYLELGSEKLDEENFRQRCLYVDFINTNNKWHKPQFITKLHATEILERSNKILDRIQWEKSLGFYTTKYYMFINEYQAPLMKKYLKKDGTFEVPLEDLPVLQDTWRVMLQDAKQKGILKGDVEFSRKI